MNPPPDTSGELRHLIKRIAYWGHAWYDGPPNELADISEEQAIELFKTLITSQVSEQVEEAVSRELQSLLDDETKGDTCICQQADTKVCDHNWSLCNEIRERLATFHKSNIGDSKNG